MRTLLWGAAFGLLLPACEYEISPDVPDASGPFIGNVTLQWAPTSDAVTADFTTPQFANVLQFWDAGCLGTQVGSCCAYAQPEITNPTGPGTSNAEPITASAGTITVTDLSDTANQTLGNFDFAGIGYYPLSSAETPSLLWSPGDTLSVSASGGLVDGFSGMITAPAAFTDVSPGLTLTGQIVVSLATDFTVTWTPGPDADAGGIVTVDLFDPLGFYIDCTVPDSAGSVTVPVAAFDLGLDAGEILSGDNGYVTLYRPVSETLSSDNATVTLTAEASDPGLATFQHGI
jgi:hypothetical protein